MIIEFELYILILSFDSTYIWSIPKSFMYLLYMTAFVRRFIQDCAQSRNQFFHWKRCFCMIDIANLGVRLKQIFVDQGIAVFPYFSARDENSGGLALSDIIEDVIDSLQSISPVFILISLIIDFQSWLVITYQRYYFGVQAS